VRSQLRSVPQVVKLRGDRTASERTVGKPEGILLAILSPLLRLAKAVSEFSSLVAKGLPIFLLRPNDDPIGNSATGRGTAVSETSPHGPKPPRHALLSEEGSLILCQEQRRNAILRPGVPEINQIIAARPSHLLTPNGLTRKLRFTTVRY
jgi:hypothetical protein